MFRLIAINFSQKSHHFSLLSSTSPCELSEREVTSPSNLKVVRAQSDWWSYIFNPLTLHSSFGDGELALLLFGEKFLLWFGHSLAKCPVTFKAFINPAI
jgi:hypothetical protein